MLRNAGGSRTNTAVGYGLVASLFVFGWVVLGFMLFLDSIFGGADPQPLSERSPGGTPAAA